MSKSITIFNADGTHSEYKRLSARIPEFRAAFPAEDGYRVNIEYLDPIEAKPGLKELYATALQAGQKPQEVGLPEMKEGKMIFRATLISPDGHVLETGSAVYAITTFKDWEKGESAARNRLLAALGFGGDVLDEDEDGNITDQGATVGRPQESAAGDASASQPAEAEATVASQPHNESSPQSGEDAAAASTSHSATPDADASASDVTPVLPGLMRQIEHQANLKGLTLGEDIRRPASNEDAKAVLKEIMSNTG